jgi:FtsH-binding integral membrane protein
LSFASQASVDERADFIGKTYLHLGGAILAFAALTAGLLQTNFAEVIAKTALGNGPIGYLIFFGCFFAASWLANSWAQSSTSASMQYGGLGLYVVAEAIFFAPLLWIASTFGGPEVIPTAGVLTAIVFLGLTAIVYMTRYNFSFLGPALSVVGFGVMALFLVSMVMGYSLSSLGIWLPAGMVVFAGLYILYDTSNVLHNYRVGQHVAASLALFSSVTLLFWYMIRLVMAMKSEE